MLPDVKEDEKLPVETKPPPNISQNIQNTNENSSKPKGKGKIKKVDIILKNCIFFLYLFNFDAFNIWYFLLLWVNVNGISTQNLIFYLLTEKFIFIVSGKKIKLYNFENEKIV